MHYLPVTSVTAAIAAVMLVALGVMTGMRRTRTNILLGTGEDEDLLRRVRAHGNFIEYTPIALIILMLAEVQGHGMALLWTMSALLIAGRALHAIGILRSMIPARATGMLMTLGSILLGAALLLLR